MKRGFSAVEARVYDRLLGSAVAEAVAPAIQPAVVGERILDVGCGGGQLTRRLGAIGVDPRPRHGGIPAVAGALPFRDASFDTVVSSCSIKHWPDMAAGVAELRRVLRPDGALVVVEMDRDATVDDMRRFARLTRVPRPLRSAYARFDVRAVLPTALTADELAAVVGGPATKIDGLPFNVVSAGR